MRRGSLASHHQPPFAESALFCTPTLAVILKHSMRTQIAVSSRNRFFFFPPNGYTVAILGESLNPDLVVKAIRAPQPLCRQTAAAFVTPQLQEPHSAHFCVLLTVTRLDELFLSALLEHLLLLVAMYKSMVVAAQSVQSML